MGGRGLHRRIEPYQGKIRGRICAIRVPRPPERHTAGSDAGDQPSRPYAAATVARTLHSAQGLPYRNIPAIEGSQLRHGKRALAVAPGRKTIDGQIEAGQLVQRTGKDGGALSAGRGIGGSVESTAGSGRRWLVHLIGAATIRSMCGHYAVFYPLNIRPSRASAQPSPGHGRSRPRSAEVGFTAALDEGTNQDAATDQRALGNGRQIRNVS